MSSERQELLHAVGMMDEAERFLQSNLGRYLIERAEGERDEAFDAFKTADPENTKQIRDLQNRIWRAEQFQFWLADLIDAGRNAVYALQEREQE